jgi:hypothetical protein
MATWQSRHTLFQPHVTEHPFRLPIFAAPNVTITGDPPWTESELTPNVIEIFSNLLDADRHAKSLSQQETRGSLKDADSQPGVLAAS